MATIDSKEYQEHIKCRRIEKAVDILKEEAYLSDLYIEEDNYDSFFEQLYNFFETNEIINFYMHAMTDFIAKCITEKKEINFQLLVDDLDKLKCVNPLLPSNRQFSDLEIAQLKEIMLSKRKSFSLN